MTQKLRAAGTLQNMPKGCWIIYRVDFRPYSAQRKAGGQIHFKAITGRVEVWLGKNYVAKKDEVESGPLTVRFPPDNHSRPLSLLLQSIDGGSVGIGGTVVIEPL